MDRMYWSPSTLLSGETSITTVSGIRLYDGNKKIYEDGHLTLTSIRLLWRNSSNNCLALDLGKIVLIEEESGGFTSCSKIILHLGASSPNANSFSSPSNSNTFIKLGFRQSGMTQFHQTLEITLNKKSWESTAPTPVNISTSKKLHAGILGIERNIEAKHRETSSSISHAFEDLKNLMGLAKDMVNISKNIAKKIKEETGEISSDETVQLRSYLLSLGVDDPVTKEAVGSTTEYHTKLAQEICNVLEAPVTEIGGVMLLSEVYCRINRARGMHLISPEDVHNACGIMTMLNLNLNLFTFQSGVQVLQLSSMDEGKVSKAIESVLYKNQSNGVSAAEFAHISGVPLLLAQERMFNAERCAVAVRDESNEGLRFYPNLFITN